MITLPFAEIAINMASKYSSAVSTSKPKYVFGEDDFPSLSSSSSPPKQPSKPKNVESCHGLETHTIDSDDMFEEEILGSIFNGISVSRVHENNEIPDVFYQKKPDGNSGFTQTNLPNWVFDDGSDSYDACGKYYDENLSDNMQQMQDEGYCNWDNIPFTDPHSKEAFIWVKRRIDEWCNQTFAKMDLQLKAAMSSSYFDKGICKLISQQGSLGRVRTGFENLPNIRMSR